jgi:hypothetical protein
LVARSETSKALMMAVM